MKPYPLRFDPVAVERPWGGTAFSDILGKVFKYKDEDGNEHTLPPETALGECYEIADLGECGETLVSNGMLAGNTLEEITDTYMEELIGDNPSQYFGSQFPIMVRLADIRGSLPVHVHPDDHTAFERYDALGKKELWYIMEAGKDAALYLGFNKELSAQELFERCMAGTIKETMHRIVPKKGDMIEIPAGMAHCAEGGILAGIIEEPSLIRFDLYGNEGTPQDRISHIGECLDFIRLGMSRPSDHISRKTGLVSDSDEFTVKHTEMKAGEEKDYYLEDIDSAAIFLCVEGKASFRCNPEKNLSGYSTVRGEAVVIPASADSLMITAGPEGCTLLEATLRERTEQDSYTDR